MKKINNTESAILKKYACSSMTDQIKKGGKRYKFLMSVMKKEMSFQVLQILKGQ